MDLSTQGAEVVAQYDDHNNTQQYGEDCKSSSGPNSGTNYKVNQIQV